MPDPRPTTTDISELAHQRAEVYAPRAPYDPVHAGGVGLFVTGLPLAVFTGLAGLGDRHAFALGVTLALGFLIPFAYLKNQNRLHYKAWAKEYTALKAEKERA